jgi:translation initiation factor 2B subunit (eIF-2B alpha/beta/delta family)
MPGRDGGVFLIEGPGRGLMMSADWERLVARIRRDRRSGASALLARGVEAARLFLTRSRHLSPARLESALGKFTLRLTASQPSMATFLTLANALWRGRGDATPRSSGWERLHEALVEFADGIDAGLRATVRHAASLVRPRSLALTYSNSTAVQLALWQAVSAGRRFEVVCSESRPMREGVTLARRLAALGIPVHLVVDAALAQWVGKADLVLLGADAVTPDAVVNKVGTDTLLHAARRAGAPAYVLADSSKWLPDRLARLWRVREEDPAEIVRPGMANLTVHNRYFERSPLSLITGLVWEGGVVRPGEARRRIAPRPVSGALVRLLEREGATRVRSCEVRPGRGRQARGTDALG